MTKPTEQLIEEGLEKRFDDTFPFGVCHVSNMTRMPDATVKDFIRIEIAEAYERGKKESDDKWQGLIKTAAKNSKKELAEAIERTQVDFEKTLTGLMCEFSNTPIDARMTGWHWLKIARERIKEPLRDNPIKEK